VIASGQMYEGVPTTPSPVARGHGQQRLVERLGDAEVDDPVERASLLLADQDVEGLEVAVDHPLLVGVQHLFANVDEQREAPR